MKKYIKLENQVSKNKIKIKDYKKQKHCSQSFSPSRKIKNDL